MIWRFLQPILLFIILQMLIFVLGPLFSDIEILLSGDIGTFIGGMPRKFGDITYNGDAFALLSIPVSAATVVGLTVIAFVSPGLKLWMWLPLSFALPVLVYFGGEQLASINVKSSENSTAAGMTYALILLPNFVMLIVLIVILPIIRITRKYLGINWLMA